MGIERFEDGDDPTPPADADPSKDADRSEEVASSSDVRRAEDQTPDSPRRESPEDVADKQAEPRTRDEYADHLAPPNSSPIDENPPNHNAEEPFYPEDEQRQATPFEKERSDSSYTERQQAEDRLKPDNDLEGSDEQSPSSEDLPDPADSEEARSGEPDDENSHTPQLARGTDSGTDIPRAQHAHQADDERLGDAPDHEDIAQEHAANPESRDAQDNDRPHSLSDQEWTEHLEEVRDGLDAARREGLRTIQLYTIDEKGQIWSEERDLLHDSIIEDFYAEAKDVPCDFKAIMAGGLGGAGKTTVLTEHAGIDLTQYLMINPDNFKEEMARRGMLSDIEGLSPMEASDLAHEESSYLAKRLARRAEAEGKNLIWDITMASKDSTEGRIESLREAGYVQVDGIFIDIPIELSVERTESRHREGHENYRSGVGLGGRFVPPEVIRSQGDKEWPSQNRRTFEAVKNDFSTWRIYDNSIDHRPAELIDSSRRRYEL